MRSERSRNQFKYIFVMLLICVAGVSSFAISMHYRHDAFAPVTASAGIPGMFFRESDPGEIAVCHVVGDQQAALSRDPAYWWVSISCFCVFAPEQTWWWADVKMTYALDMKLFPPQHQADNREPIEKSKLRQMESRAIPVVLHFIKSLPEEDYCSLFARADHVPPRQLFRTNAAGAVPVLRHAAIMYNIALWIAITMALVFVAFNAIRLRQIYVEKLRRRNDLCIQCGYPGVSNGVRCPECGSIG